MPARRYEGKIVLVTASSTGIGFGISERMAKEGATVIISSRKQTNVDDAVQRLKNQGLSAYGFVCHVGKKEHRVRLFNFIRDEFGRLDVLVPNAAVSTWFGSLFNINEKQYDKMFDINIKAVFFMVKEYLPLMPRGKLKSNHVRLEYPTCQFIRRLSVR